MVQFVAFVDATAFRGILTCVWGNFHKDSSTLRG